eukprot:15007774-Ditylum_brightwellii.AAC.1
MIKTLISYHYHAGINFNIDDFRVQQGAMNMWEKNINRNKNNNKTGTYTTKPCKGEIPSDLHGHIYKAYKKWLIPDPSHYQN